MICRDHYATLLVVHVNTTLDIALTRNANRSSEYQHHVDDDTIKRINERFEGPKNTQIADKNSIVLLATDDSTSSIQIIKQKLIELKANTIKRTISHNTNTTHTHNIIHNIDNSIRKIVSAAYKSVIKDTNLKKELGKNHHHHHHHYYYHYYHHHSFSIW